MPHKYLQNHHIKSSQTDTIILKVLFCRTKRLLDSSSLTTIMAKFQGDRLDLHSNTIIKGTVHP